MTLFFEILERVILILEYSCHVIVSHLLEGIKAGSFPRGIPSAPCLSTIMSSSQYQTADDCLPSPSDSASPQEARFAALEARLAVLEHELQALREWVLNFIRLHNIHRSSPQGSDLSEHVFRDITNTVGCHGGSSPRPRRAGTPYHRSAGTSDVILSSPFYNPNSTLVAVSDGYPSSQSSRQPPVGIPVIPPISSSSESDPVIHRRYYINQTLNRRRRQSRLRPQEESESSA